MRGGHVDTATRMQVTGWAADAQRPDTVLELCIMLDGTEIARIMAARPRQDVAALGKYGTIGHGFAHVFATPLPAHRDHTISVRFAEDMRLLPNGERRIARDPDAAPPAAPSPSAVAPPAKPNPAPPGGPHPILVTAPGRSGTTYLMSCLAAAPQITVAELVPYEVRLLSYYAAAYGVLTAPADPDRSTHPDRLEGDGFHIGFNPFSGPQYAHAFRGRAALDDFSASWAPARLGQAMADIVQEYYRRLATDQRKDKAAWFAEKNNNLHKPSRLFVRRVFPAMREIVIVRDPRDVLCSHMAYFESSQDKAFQQLSHASRQLVAISDTAGPEICVIRYEDMIRGDAPTFARLSSFLGAEVAQVAGEAGGRMFEKHGTSATPEASIGRWRQHLPPDMQAKSTQAWNAFLAKFGYDLA